MRNTILTAAKATSEFFLSDAKGCELALKKLNEELDFDRSLGGAVLCACEAVIALVRFTPSMLLAWVSSKVFSLLVRLFHPPAEGGRK